MKPAYIFDALKSWGIIITVCNGKVDANFPPGKEFIDITDTDLGVALLATTQPVDLAVTNA